MKKFLGVIMTIAMCLMFIPNVSAEPENPGMVGGKDIFEAKGVPITIYEDGGTTKIKWDGNDAGVAIDEDTVVVLGYYNPTADKADLETTSVNVESGTVNYIIGGSVVTTGYGSLDKIHVGITTIEVNGGKVNNIDAVGGTATDANVVVPTGKADDYYSTDHVNIGVHSGEVGRIMGTTSLTYIPDLMIDITSNAKVGMVGAGTNGKVGNYYVNVTEDATVSSISSGYRAQVKTMKVNATENANVGDLYAGSYYPKTEYSDSEFWNNEGTINYGTAENIEFNLEENVKYNNIYAGFQFVSEDLTKFQSEHDGVELPASIATAPVSIVAPDPQTPEAGNGAISMFTLANTNSNITVASPAAAEVPVTPNTPQTFDGIVGVVGVGILSVLGLAISASYLRRKRYN